MSERKKLMIPFEEIYYGLFESMREQDNFSFTVTGDSMWPFLREGKDIVTLESCSFSQLKIHDIVLIQRDDGAFVLHRVIRFVNDGFIMRGDAQFWNEGPLRPDQLRGRVCGIQRGETTVDMGHPTQRFLVGLWVITVFPRRVIAKIIREARKCVNLIRRK